MRSWSTWPALLLRRPCPSTTWGYSPHQASFRAEPETIQRCIPEEVAESAVHFRNWPRCVAEAARHFRGLPKRVASPAAHFRQFTTTRCRPCISPSGHAPGRRGAACLRLRGAAPPGGGAHAARRLAGPRGPVPLRRPLPAGGGRRPLPLRHAADPRPGRPRRRRGLLADFTVDELVRIFLETPDSGFHQARSYFESRGLRLALSPAAVRGRPRRGAREPSRRPRP